jgi:anaerobic selenocysteine-containing dehydrogenase/ferredoxin
MSDGIGRREFIRLLGASSASAGLVGCSTDHVQKLLPYVVAPETITPGVATWYSTVCTECPAGCGAWVKTLSGRAIKVEGNTRHPVSGGTLCSRGHSSLQGLYDPDRLTQPMRRSGDGFEPVSWDEAESILADGVRSAGSDVVLLSGRAGPALTSLQNELAGALGGRRIEYEAISEAPLREASRMVFGADAVPSFDFESAGIVYSFGADFLGGWLSPVEYGRGFARASGTDEDGRKARMVFVGPRLPLTGQNADEWIPVDPGAEGLVALAVAHAIARDGGNAGPYADLLAAYDPQSVAAQVGLSAETLEDLASRFASEGPGLAVGPGVAGQGRNATATNLAVLVLNAVAGSVGRTIHPEAPDLGAASSAAGDLLEALPQMTSGQVRALIVQRANPAYSLPAAAGFAEAMSGVPFTAVISDRMDETASLADLVLPERHFLESWGDSNPRPGVWAVQQPAMQPVPHFDSRASGDVLLALAGALGQDLGAETFYDYLRARWLDLYTEAGSPDDSFESFWRRLLAEGTADLGGAPPVEPTLQTPDRALTFEAPTLDGEGLALIVYPSSRLWDGRFANRTWLQELPDPVSKISWHSWVELHPETADELGVSTGDIVRITSANGEVEAPVWTYPGIRRNTAALATGGGHTSFGRFSDDRGVNPMNLLPAEVEQPSGGLVQLVTRVQIEPTGERRLIATVAGSTDDRDRPIVPAVELAALQAGELEEREPRELHELQAVGGFVPIETEGRPQDYPLEGSRHGQYDPTQYPRWSMAIDLDKCTGCSACVTACQAENNVPVVGEQQMMRGRDIQWIRLERFYHDVNADEASPCSVSTAGTLPASRYARCTRPTTRPKV